MRGSLAKRTPVTPYCAPHADCLCTPPLRQACRQVRLRICRCDTPSMWVQEVPKRSAAVAGAVLEPGQGTWVAYQRWLWRRGRLSPEQMRLLRLVGVDMVMDTADEWRAMAHEAAFFMHGCSIGRVGLAAPSLGCRSMLCRALTGLPWPARGLLIASHAMASLIFLSTTVGSAVVKHDLCLPIMLCCSLCACLQCVHGPLSSLPD